MIILYIQSQCQGRQSKMGGESLSIVTCKHFLRNFYIIHKYIFVKNEEIDKSIQYWTLWSKIFI